MGMKFADLELSPGQTKKIPAASLVRRYELAFDLVIMRLTRRRLLKLGPIVAFPSQILPPLGAMTGSG